MPAVAVCKLAECYNRTYDYVERELPKIPDSIPVLVLANHRDMGHHRTITDDQVRTHIEHLDRLVVPSTDCSNYIGGIQLAESSFRSV